MNQPAIHLQLDPDFRMRESLRNLGVTTNSITPQERASFDRHGYLALRGILSPNEVIILRERLRKLLRAEGPNAGVAQPTEEQLEMSWSNALESRLYRGLFHTVRGGARNLFRLSPKLKARLAASSPSPGAYPRLAPDALDRLRSELGTMLRAEANQEGGGVRLQNLVNKSPIFDRCFTHPRILAGIQHLLGFDFRLSSLEARTPRPGHGRQALHADFTEHAEPGSWLGCSAIWVLDDYSGDNGATRVVPGSHLSNRLPAKVIPNPRKLHSQQRILEEPAGTVILLNGHTWHGGTLNHSEDERWVVQAFFGRRGDETRVDQKSLVTHKTLRRLSTAARAILDADEDVGYGARLGA